MHVDTGTTPKCMLPFEGGATGMGQFTLKINSCVGEMGGLQKSC